MSQDLSTPTVDRLENEFHRLTQRAILVVIARAARRVLPLLVHEDPQGSFAWPIHGVIRLAECLASGGYVAPFDANEAQKAIRQRDSEENLWRDWTSSYNPRHVRACAEHLAMATRFAAYAIANEYEAASTVQGPNEQRHVPRAAAVASLEALEALMSSPVSNKENADLFLEQERSCLASKSPQAFRTLGEPINPGPGGLLGPLWPSGPPSWYYPTPLSWLGLFWPLNGSASGYEPALASSERLTPWETLPLGLLSEMRGPDPRPEPSVSMEMFVANPQVARLALFCQDRGHPETVPDLTVTSRRAVPFGRSAENHLDIVQEAIGERLVRLVSGLGAKAGLGKDTPQRTLIFHDSQHFTEEVEQELVQRLGLSQEALDYPAFRTALAEDFYHWLTKDDKACQLMRGELDAGRFFIRSPVLRTRTRRG